MQRAKLERVIDGDTLDVMLKGHVVRVRTVQIDAPESSSLRFGHPDRCGEPAKNYAKSLLRKGSTLTLEFSGTDPVDKYGRLLALVHLGGPGAITWQQKMTRAGWAEVFVFKENRTRLLATLREDENYARRERLGVYRLCAGEFHEHD